MRTSILSIRLLFIPLIGFLLEECISYTTHQESVSVGAPLPIDGTWKTSVTHHSITHDFYYKIERGRMYLADVKGPDSLAYADGIGKLFFGDIHPLGGHKYACKIFSIYGTPSMNGVLEVVDNKLLVSPRNPILIQELTNISLVNKELYDSSHTR